MKSLTAMTSRRSCRGRGRKGFSLAELLTAMAVTSLLMIALFSMVGQSSTNYKISSRKVTTMADSRALFHFLENDLASHITGTKFFLVPDANGQTQMAFVRQRDAQQSDATGDLVGCYYYLAFTADDRRRGSPKLFRRTLDANATQQWLQAGENATLPTADPQIDEPMAFHVIKWEIRGQQRDAQGRWQPWTGAAGSMPGHLELILEMVDDLTAQRLTTEQQWRDLALSQDPKQREAVRRHVYRMNLR
jgi:prepilin-type N-terminal cleavage/methylation domain-containing protein